MCRSLRAVLKSGCDGCGGFRIAGFCWTLRVRRVCVDRIEAFAELLAWSDLFNVLTSSTLPFSDRAASSELAS